MMNSIYICFRWKWMPCGETKAQTIMTISFHSCFNTYLFFVSYFAGLYFGVILWNFFQIRFFNFSFLVHFHYFQWLKCLFDVFTFCLLFISMRNFSLSLVRRVSCVPWELFLIQSGIKFRLFTLAYKTSLQIYWQFCDRHCRWCGKLFS